MPKQVQETRYMSRRWWTRSIFPCLFAWSIALAVHDDFGEAFAWKARHLVIAFDSGRTLQDATLELSAQDAEQIDCLARNSYFEARNQGDEGMWAVTDVVFNRLAKPQFPGSVCEIITQPRQFSWVHDGKPHVMTDREAAAAAYRIALQAWKEAPMHYKPRHTDITGGAINYHAFYVSPKWKHLKETIQIGAHKFYKLKDAQS